MVPRGKYNTSPTWERGGGECKCVRVKLRQCVLQGESHVMVALLIEVTDQDWRSVEERRREDRASISCSLQVVQ